jgi:hypothetical protein
MDIEAVIHYFGGVKELSQALDVYPQAIYQWKASGIPLLRQYQIEVLSKGEFWVEDVEDEP